MAWSKLARKLGASNRGYKKFKKDKQQDKKIKQIAKQVNDIELKFITNVASSQVAAADTLIYLPFANVAQGDGSSARSGNKMTIKRLMLNMFVSNSSTTVPQTIRVLIVRSKYINRAALPAIANLLTPATTLGHPQYLDAVHYSDRKRMLQTYGLITLIKDFGPIRLDPVSAATANTGGMAGNYLRRLRWMKKCDYSVQYVGSAATDESLGALWVIVIGSAGPSIINYEYAMTAYYTDN